MKLDVQKGFGRIMQTEIRDTIARKRIPDELAKLPENLCQQAAEYIYELEEILIQHGIVKDES